jgi:NAD(P)-dependent dehydrogenase (short-subunit alcohol dehydrogenase family)
MKRMDLELRGKNVLVTGASKGIGLACAWGFAAEGCNIHIAARSAGELNAERDKMMKKHGVGVTSHPSDLGAAGNAVKLGGACGDIDILVNNAGAIPGGRIDQVDDETWRRAWDLKVFGYVNLTREVYGRMKKRGAGVIVNVIGVAGERNRSDYIAGTTGNAGLMAFTRALGSESVDHGVRVVGVNPGRIETERQVTGLKFQAQQKFGDESRWKEIRDAMVETLPFKRSGRVDEVADLVVFLASARASYISGTIVTIDAGQSLRSR